MRPVLHTAPLLLVLAGCSTPEPQESTFVLLQADDATLLQAPDEPTGDLQVPEADPPVLEAPEDVEPIEEEEPEVEDATPLLQVGDDEATFRAEGATTTVVGSATVSGSTLSGQFHYETVTDSGLALCDVERSLSGTASDRCPHCDFAFDVTLRTLADHSLEDCNENPLLALDCERPRRWITDPGLVWNAEATSLGTLCTDREEYSWYSDGHFVTAWPDTEAAYSEGELSWVHTETDSLAWLDEHYQPCGSVPSRTTVTRVLDNPDFVAHDTQRCERGEEIYWGPEWFETYMSPIPVYSDIFEIDATAGERLSVVVLPERAGTRFGGRLTLNGPDGCTVAHTRAEAAHCGTTQCLSADIGIETTGTHQILIATEGCPSGTASFEVQAQLD